MSRQNEPDPLVSVVIPTYERPEYLDGAIQTALDQTYEKMEIIVVDDGSSEPYADEIVGEAPDRVKTVRHEANSGLSAARNTGIRNAHGEYIAFLDDDDRWCRTKITRQVSALEEQQDAGLATCLVASITPDNELVHCETEAPSGDCSETMLIGNQIGTPSRVLVRETCFDEVGTFDESLATKQDWDFYLRLCQEWKVAAVSDHLCFKTEHESMSSSPKSAHRDNRAILEKHEDLIRSRGHWRRAQAEIEDRVGRSYLRQGNQRQARTNFKAALRRGPTAIRTLLYALTFAHPSVAQKLRQIKRGVSIRRSGCAELDLPEAVTSMDISGDDDERT